MEKKTITDRTYDMYFPPGHYSPYWNALTINFKQKQHKYNRKKREKKIWNKNPLSLVYLVGNLLKCNTIKICLERAFEQETNNISFLPVSITSTFFFFKCTGEKFYWFLVFFTFPTFFQWKRNKNKQNITLLRYK